MEDNPKFARLYQEHEAAAEDLGAKLGVDLWYRPRPPLQRVAAALKRLAKDDPDTHKDALMQWKQLKDTRTALQKEKAISSHRFNSAAKKRHARDPKITKAAIHNAGKKICQRQPQLLELTRLAMVASSQHNKIVDVLLLKGASMGAQANNAVANNSCMDGMIETSQQVLPQLAQEQDYVADHTGKLPPVIDGDVVEEADQTLVQEAGVRSCIAWIKFLNGTIYANTREACLLDFMAAVAIWSNPCFSTCKFQAAEWSFH